MKWAKKERKSFTLRGLEGAWSVPLDLVLIGRADAEIREERGPSHCTDAL